jgi:hypothetical protein
MTRQEREKLINKLKKVLSKQPIKLAYLYGSYARGQETPKSDIDIAIVLENPHCKMVFGFPADVSIHISGKEIDLRVMDEKTEPVFLHSVLKNKILLFAKDEKTRIDFEVKAMKTYFDTEHLRKLNYYYLKKSLEDNSYGRRPPNYRKIAQ